MQQDRIFGTYGANPSVDQVYAILSGALNRAAVWGWIAQNPARLASPPSIEQADM